MGMAQQQKKEKRKREKKKEEKKKKGGRRKKKKKRRKKERRRKKRGGGEERKRKEEGRRNKEEGRRKYQGMQWMMILEDSGESFLTLLGKEGKRGGRRDKYTKVMIKCSNECGIFLENKDSIYQSFKYFWSMVIT